MRALTFIVRFQTAQFKLHHQKLVRKTYLIPPPSAVAGLFGAVLGVPRRELKAFCRENGVMAGAELLSLEGFYVTLARIFKFDSERSSLGGLKKLINDYWNGSERALKDMLGTRPIKESEELFRPTYKFAVVAENKVIDEGLKRLRELYFEYEIFGGNDYHFVEDIGNVREANIIKSLEGTGYCPIDLVKDIHAYSQRFEVVRSIEYLAGRRELNLPFIVSAPVGPDLEQFFFAYRANFVTRTEVDAVYDGESKIFVFNAERYLVHEGGS